MYVKRDSNGEIIAVSQIPMEDIQENVTDDNAALHNFISSFKTPQQLALENTDQAMARVLEDVINLLVEQGTIRFTDLPNPAQHKLLSRRELRDQHQGAYLLSDEENLNI